MCAGFGSSASYAERRPCNAEKEANSRTDDPGIAEPGDDHSQSQLSRVRVLKVATNRLGFNEKTTRKGWEPFKGI